MTDVKKLYVVQVSFEGHEVGKLLVTEPSERLDALVTSGYLSVAGANLEEEAATRTVETEEATALTDREKRANAVASRGRTRKE